MKRFYYRFLSIFFQRAAQKMCQECRGFIKRGEKILDLGCGSGIMGKKIQEFFNAKVVGVDIEDERVVNLSFQKIDGKNLPFPENSFETVLISYVLHHSPDPELILKEAKRVGKKIIVFEDLPEGILSRLRCFFHQLSYNLFFDKRFRKFNFKKEKEWQNLFEKVGLKLIFKKRIFLPFDLIDPVKRILFILEK